MKEIIQIIYVFSIIIAIGFTFRWAHHSSEMQWWSWIVILYASIGYFWVIHKYSEEDYEERIE
jgi:membrane protein YdbS with pleckstrin-like domain